MKKQFYVITVLVLLAMTPAKSIRHTGTGGGEAELFVLEMFPLIQPWLKACQENPQECGVSKQEIEGFLTLKPLADVDFKNRADGPSSCRGETLLLNHEDLYQADEITPKEDQFLAAEMLSAWSQCRGTNWTVDPNQLQVIPWAKHSLKNEIAILVGVQTDVAVDVQGSLNLHQALQSRMNCRFYRVLQLQSDRLELSCKDNGDHFVAHLRREHGSLQLIVKYQSLGSSGL